MTAGSGNFKRTLHLKLTLHLGKIRNVVPFFRWRMCIRLCGYRFENVIEIIFQLKNVVNTIHFNSVNNSTLACVGFWNINFLYTAFLRFDYHGQNSVDSSDFSRKRKLADECAVGDVALNLIEQYKNCNRNRQIVNRPFFFDIGRSKVHGHMCGRVSESAVL